MHGLQREPHDVVIASFDSFDNQAPRLLDGVASRLVKRREVAVVDTDLILSQLMEFDGRFFGVGKKSGAGGDADAGEDLMLLPR